MKHAAIFIISLLFLGSCISTKYTEIEIYQPAKLSFDSTVVNVLVVDNVPNSDSKTEQTREMKLLNYPTDSAKWLFTESLTNFLNEEQYFGNVSTYPYVTRSDTVNSEVVPLTEDRVKELCAETNSDAIISIDQHVTTFNIENINLAEWAPGSAGYLLKVEMGVMLRAYTQDGRTIEPKVIEMDSLFWQETISGSRIIKIPDLQTAMKEMAVHLADKVVNAYIPHWKKVFRYYYAGSSQEMKEAEIEVSNKNWSQAALHWKERYDIEKKTNIKAQLALNIALANECLDDLDNAVEWIDVAMDNVSDNKTKLKNEITVYKQVLLDRIRMKRKLTTQIGN